MRGRNKRKFFGFIAICLLVLVIAGCGGKEENTAAVQVNQENIEYLKKYDKSITGFISRQTDILNTFNDSLSNLYTGVASREQFANILKGLITESMQLTKEVENYDVDPDIFETHSQYSQSVNATHQLLLDAIESANITDVDMDKDSLRVRYGEIKTTQASLLNSWKILKEQLKNPVPVAQ